MAVKRKNENKLPSMKERGARNVLPIDLDAAEDYDLNAQYPTVSLDEFYSDVANFSLTDE